MEKQKNRSDFKGKQFEVSDMEPRGTAFMKVRGLSLGYREVEVPVYGFKIYDEPRNDFDVFYFAKINEVFIPVHYEPQSGEGGERMPATVEAI